MSITSSPITVQVSNQSHNSIIQNGLERISISKNEQDELDSINSDDQKITNKTNLDTDSNNSNNSDTIRRDGNNTKETIVNNDDSIIVTKVITDDTMSSSPSSYTSNKTLPTVAYINSEIDRKFPKKSLNLSNSNINSNNNKSTKNNAPNNGTLTFKNNEIINNNENEAENYYKDDKTDGTNDINNNFNNADDADKNSSNDNDKNTNTKDNELINIKYIVQSSTEMIIKMLTSLLNKIIHSNDKLSNMNPIQPIKNTCTGGNPDYYNSCISAIMSFKGKHVPQIELEQYFYRIQKYCPTTNDIFLSLLIYFDRISKKCNNLTNYMTNLNKVNRTEDSVNTIPKANDEISVENNDKDNTENNNEENDTQLFAMDSYNIHRLIITAIAVSTKFSSDYFYSNSRYSKVGGISLREMNYLELQFLILCDFNLLITVEEYERYANLLYKFCSNQDLI